MRSPERERTTYLWDRFQHQINKNLTDDGRG